MEVKVWNSRTGQNSTVGKEITAHPCQPRCGNVCDHPWGTWNWDCVKVAPPEEQLGDPEKSRVRKDRLLDPWGGDSFCLIPLTVFLSCPFPLPISFYPFASHLLLNRIPSIDFGTWSPLHLNLARGTS